MPAQERLAVEGHVDVGGVRDGLAHHDDARHGGLLEATQHTRRAAAVHHEVAGAVQDLGRQVGETQPQARTTLEGTSPQSSMQATPYVS